METQNTHARWAARLLVIGTVAIMALLVLTTASVAANDEPTATDQLLASINAERAAVGCPPVVQNWQLNAAAQHHAEDMAINNYVSHYSQDGRTFIDRINAEDYAWLEANENVGAGIESPETMVALWMQSQYHHDNIVNCNVTEIGIGFAYQADDQRDVVMPDGSIDGPFHYYWVTDMAAPAGE